MLFFAKRDGDGLEPACNVTNDDWMTNTAGQSPCQVARILYTPCAGANFVLAPLTPGNHYIPGNSSSQPNRCSCSWSVYNLLQACSACQVQDGSTDIQTWDSWTNLCGNNDPNLITQDTWYPPSLTIPSGVSVPRWAVNNPTNWTNHRFDLPQASIIASKKFPDSTNQSDSLPPSPRPEVNHGAPTGTIVGSVIGGLALLTLVVFLVWYARFKSKTSFSHFNIPLRPHFHYPSNSTSKHGLHSANGHSSQSNGQLGMVVQSNNRTTIVHARQHSNESGGTFQSLTSMGGATSPPGHIRQISGESMPPPMHARTLSGETVTRMGSGSPETIITPWYPPEQVNTDSEEPPSSPGMGRKAREALRATAPSPSSSRRMNPPTYENSLPAGRPPNLRTNSNASSGDLTHNAGGMSTPSMSASMLPGLEQGSSAASGASPAVASSTAYPPGIPTRLMAVNED